jgi:hypothetical protein
MTTPAPPPLRCWDCYAEGCFDTYWSRDTTGPHTCDCGAELRLRPEGAEAFAELDAAERGPDRGGPGGGG